MKNILSQPLNILVVNEEEQLWQNRIEKYRYPIRTYPAYYLINWG